MDIENFIVPGVVVMFTLVSFLESYNLVTIFGISVGNCVILHNNCWLFADSLLLHDMYSTD